MRVTGLDHLVLRVGDVERSLAYYCGVLGLPGERVAEWRKGELPFPSVRVAAGTIIDLLQAPRTGENVDHLCLVVPARLGGGRPFSQHRDSEGTAQLFGARGTGTSIYTRDPDGNTVELRHYGD